MENIINAIAEIQQTGPMGCIIPGWVEAKTYPSGPRGVGIEGISQDKNTLTIRLDNGQSYEIKILDWWFGTRGEYNALTPAQRQEKAFYFIEEGS